jgi:hypothetical protein
LFNALNPGAPSNGLFPNSDTVLQGNPNETMAQTRARVMCRLSIGSACSPSVNVIYNDFWTDIVAAGRAKDLSFDYCYSSGSTDISTSAVDNTIKHVCASKLETATPVRAGCEASWNGGCRIVINYVQHIQPLWDKLRASANDNACTSCHSKDGAVQPTAAANTCQVLTNGVRVPCGQLDLTATPDDDEPDHLRSYERLLRAHNAQKLNDTMTDLQDICLLRDPVTDVCIQFQSVTASMSALNASGSRFFNAMNNATHKDLMTPSELRLISEWLDIGAQYYNDPFLAPVN